MARTSYGIVVGGLIISLCAVAWGQAPPVAAPVVVQGRTLFHGSNESGSLHGPRPRGGNERAIDSRFERSDGFH